MIAPCGFRDCNNRPAPFPGQMSYKATKPGLALSIIYLSMLYTVLLFIRAPFNVLLVFVCMCSVFKLFWLSCHYLPSDWLERLRWGSHSRGEGIISIKPRPKSVWLSWFIVLFLCLIAWYFYIALRLYMMYFLPLWHNIACLCWNCR